MPIIILSSRLFHKPDYHAQRQQLHAKDGQHGIEPSTMSIGDGTDPCPDTAPTIVAHVVQSWRQRTPFFGVACDVADGRRLRDKYPWWHDGQADDDEC